MCRLVRVIRVPSRAPLASLVAALALAALLAGCGTKGDAAAGSGSPSVPAISFFERAAKKDVPGILALGTPGWSGRVKDGTSVASAIVTGEVSPRTWDLRMVDIQGERATVVVRVVLAAGDQTSPAEDLRFTLVRADGTWRIDDVE